jgi:uncharacterized OB-fold protein
VTVFEGMLVPTVDAVSAPFWAGTAAGELRVQACALCGRTRFPPRPMCPRCQSVSATWKPVAGTGTVWSFIVPHPPLLPGYTEQAPYNSILVGLDEHPDIRLAGNLLAAPGGAINEVDPATIAIGERVRAVFVPVDDEITLLQWVRA